MANQNDGQKSNRVKNSDTQLDRAINDNKFKSKSNHTIFRSFRQIENGVEYTAHLPLPELIFHSIDPSFAFSLYKWPSCEPISIPSLAEERHGDENTGWSVGKLHTLE